MDTVTCEYCDIEYVHDGYGDDLVCVASGINVCVHCRPDHLGICGACAADLHSA